MLQRLLLALRAGVDLDIESHQAATEQQTLAVSTRWDADGGDDDEVDGTPIDEAPAKPSASGAVSAELGADLDGEPLPSPPTAKAGGGGEGGSGGGAEGERALPKEALRELEVKMMEFTDSVRSHLPATSQPPGAQGHRGARTPRPFPARDLRGMTHPVRRPSPSLDTPPLDYGPPSSLLPLRRGNPHRNPPPDWGAPP